MAYTNLRVHSVWSTKDRKQLVAEGFEDDLYAYIGGILRKRKHVLLAAGGMEDHKTLSFKDEFLARLRKHRIEFDERYVFE